MESHEYVESYALASIASDCVCDAFECGAEDLDAWCDAVGIIIAARLRMDTFRVAAAIHSPGDRHVWAADALASELGHDREIRRVERVEGSVSWSYGAAPRMSRDFAEADMGEGRFLRVVAPVLGLRETRTLTLQAEPLVGDAFLREHEVEAITVLAPAVARVYAHRFGRLREHRKALLEVLRPAQRIIAPLLAEGRSEASVADQLGRSRHTVHDHARKIYRAWGVTSRMQLRDVWMDRTASAGDTDLTT